MLFTQGESAEFCETKLIYGPLLTLFLAYVEQDVTGADLLSDKDHYGRMLPPARGLAGVCIPPRPAQTPSPFTGITEHLCSHMIHIHMYQHKWPGLREEVK